VSVKSQLVLVHIEMIQNSIGSIGVGLWKLFFEQVFRLVLIIILKCTWLLWKHHNSCVFDGVLDPV
jgi:hypothetical protein